MADPIPQTSTEQPVNPIDAPAQVASGDYTLGGIFLVWGGLLLFGFLLMRRVKQGVFRFANKDEKSFLNVPAFQPIDQFLAFMGSMMFVVGFGMIVLDLFRD